MQTGGAMTQKRLSSGFSTDLAVLPTPRGNTSGTAGRKFIISGGAVAPDAMPFTRAADR